MFKTTIGDLLNVIPYSSFYGDINAEISGITCNSKEVEPLNIFAALKGYKQDGRIYAKEAVEKGAVAVLSHSDPLEDFPFKNIPWIVCQNERLSFAIASSYLYPIKSRKPKLVGITGTNGKTTIVYLLRSIFNLCGGGAILSTIEYDDGKTLKEAQRTTPEADFINKWLCKISEAEIPYAAMEVSSHSLELHRVSSLEFDSVGFTNLTRDHLDFHKTMENYFEAKKKIFSLLKKDGFSVINIEDEYGRRVASEINKGSLFKVGVSSSADIYPEDVSISLNGIAAIVSTPWGKLKIDSKLTGKYNLMNILFAVAFSCGFKIEKECIEEGIRNFGGVPGRLQRVDAGQDFYVFVDYAHSDDSLRNVLLSLKPLISGKLITIFGCGGDRDKTKRPLMGAVSTKLSDVVILTTDNSRSEEPEDIARDIEPGIFSELNESKKYIKELDRRKAIEKSFELAEKGDVVLIAGKGHERTQTIKSNITPFHDPTVALEILKELKK
ncbi:MAG: UDP-N-acetylmuramoyl-L-alanyl-D-glutamate--2,6-diaminopimelate ligase [Acidobacteriota bacterium]